MNQVEPEPQQILELLKLKTAMQKELVLEWVLELVLQLDDLELELALHNELLL